VYYDGEGDLILILELNQEWKIEEEMEFRMLNLSNPSQETSFVKIV